MPEQGLQPRLDTWTTTRWGDGSSARIEIGRGHRRFNFHAHFSIPRPDSPTYASDANAAQLYGEYVAKGFGMIPGSDRVSVSDRHEEMPDSLSFYRDNRIGEQVMRALDKEVRRALPELADPDTEALLSPQQVREAVGWALTDERFVSLARHADSYC